MKKTLYLFGLFLVIGALALTACGGGNNTNGEEPGAGEPGDTEQNGAGALDRPEPPDPYAGMTNPIEGDTAAIEAGQTIFQNNCGSCHGQTGEGDGPAASALDPAPQNLAENQSGLSDSYIFWRINEGGTMAPFNSTMPAWDGVLSDDQIWNVVAYIRTLD